MSEKTEHIEVQNRSRISVISTILMVAGLSVLAAVYWNKNVTVNRAYFAGNYYTDTETLEETAALTFGVNPDSLDLAAVTARLEALPYVKNAIPYVEPNGNLKISIIEREPIALLIQDDKRSYVDTDGMLLPILAGKIKNVPLVYGFEISRNNRALQAPEFLQIKDFLVAAQKNRFGWVTISEVAYEPKTGVVALSQENGVKLLFGDNDFDIKFENWEAFYAEIIRTKGIAKFRQIDLRFLNQVVTHES